MRESRIPRVVRGFFAATFATFAALLAHLAGGGTMPGWLGVAVPLILSFAVCTVMSGRHVSPVRISLGVVVSQFLFHALFVVGLVTPSGAVGAHDHHAMIVLAGPPSALFTAETAMWGWHAVAAVATIYVLVHGEMVVAAVRTLAVRLVTWARRAVSVTTITRVEPSFSWIGDASVRAAKTTYLSSSITRRGPPAPSAC